VPRQRIDGRLHPLPAALHSRNHDDGRATASVNDVHGRAPQFRKGLPVFSVC
jgi:hypothetical protein